MDMNIRRNRHKFGNLIIIYLMLITQFCKCTQKILKEGELAELVFQYQHLDKVRFQLHKNNQPPFYDSEGVSKSDLTAGQQRFHVTVESHNKSTDHPHLIFVHISIENVSREDAGTYICDGYSGGQKLVGQTKRIGLHVDFPPGKASCRTDGAIIPEAGWICLACTAPVGSLAGYINCYQNGQQMPPCTQPTQNKTMLIQSIWIQRSHTVFCCTSTYETKRDRCECKDFIWDPFFGTVYDNGINPCKDNIAPSKRESSIIQEQSSTKPPPKVDNDVLGNNSNGIVVDGEERYRIILLVAVFCGSMLAILLVIAFIYILCTKRKSANKCNTINYVEILNLESSIQQITESTKQTTPKKEISQQSDKEKATPPKATQSSTNLPEDDTTTMCKEEPIVTIIEKGKSVKQTKKGNKFIRYRSAAKSS